MLLVKQINSSQHINILVTSMLNYKHRYVSYSDHPFTTKYLPSLPSSYPSTQVTLNPFDQSTLKLLLQIMLIRKIQQSLFRPNLDF